MKKYNILFLIMWGALSIFYGCSHLLSSEQRKIKLFQSHIKSAQEYEQKTEYVKAYEEYKLALTVDPSNETTMKKKEELEGKLKRLSDIHCNTGIKFLKLGKFKSAQKHFLKSTYYWPENEKAASYLSKNKKMQDNSEYVIYELKSGDSLSKLAKQYYGDYKKYRIIAEFNNIQNATNARVGQKIKIPKIEGLPFNPPPERIAEKKEKKDIDAVKAKTVEATPPPSAQSPPIPMAVPADIILPEATDDKEVDEVETKIVEISSFPSVQSTAIPMDDTIDDEPLLEATAEAAEEEMVLSEKESQPEPTDHDEETKTIEGYRESGIGLFNKNNYDMAIAEFEKLINIVPDDIVANDYLEKCHFNLGVIEFEKKEYQLAKKQFRQAKQYNDQCSKCDEYSMKCDLEFKDMHFKKGVALYSQQKLTEAIEEWQLVQALDPEYMDVEKHIVKAETLLKRLQQIKQE